MTDPWRALAAHNPVCSELDEWDEETIELSVSGGHRVILNTKHGTVFIDVRGTDVNAFVFVDGQRLDTVLLRAPDNQSAPTPQEAP